MSAMETAVRNCKKIHDDLVDKGDATLTKSGCYIYIPVSYVAKGLAFIADKIQILGVFAITTDKRTYGASSCTTLIEITPSSYEEINIFDEPYYEFCFDSGTVVFPNRKVVCQSNLVYDIVDYIYNYCNIPFWFNAIDHAELLSNCKFWNNLGIYSDQIVCDIYAAQTQRSNKDPNKFFKDTIKKDSDIYNPVQFIPLTNGSLNKTSRIAKLADVELKRGIRNALLNDPVRAEPLEDLLMR